MGQGPLLSSVRAYLGVTRQLDLTIDDSLTSFLENQLVEERKKNKELDPSTMHSWLTVNSTYATLAKSPQCPFDMHQEL